MRACAYVSECVGMCVCTCACMPVYVYAPDSLKGVAVGEGDGFRGDTGAIRVFTVHLEAG